MFLRFERGMAPNVMLGRQADGCVMDKVEARRVLDEQLAAYGRIESQLGGNGNATSGESLKPKPLE